MKLSERYSWTVVKTTGGWCIALTCNAKGRVWDEKLQQEVDNPRSPEAGSVTTFCLADKSIIGSHLIQHMASLTDDQCDSFFPQKPVKKSKKA